MSGGDMKFLYAMKLVPPKDLGSIVHPGTWHYPLGVLTLGTVTGNHVAHIDFFFKSYNKWACIHDFSVSL